MRFRGGNQDTNHTDIELQKDVLEELKWDARIHPDVGVTVDDSIDTLAGTVGSCAKRVAADEAAHGVGGLRHVANQQDKQSTHRSRRGP